MKLASAQKVHYDSGPNMTPLVDIVMVILIFLMLTGTFAGASWYLRSNLPPLEGAATPTVTETFGKDFKIDIVIRTPRDSSVPLDTMCAYVAGGTQQYNDDQKLTEKLRLVREEAKSKFNKKDEDIQVIIRPEAMVNYQVLVRVHAAALNADLTKIAFATAGSAR